MCLGLAPILALAPVLLPMPNKNEAETETQHNQLLSPSLRCYATERGPMATLLKWGQCGTTLCAIRND